MDDPQIQQPNVPETTEIHPAPRRNWFVAHWILGIVFLLAVAGVAVAGIYYWQTVRQIPAVVDLPVHKNFDADWKTYTNSQYGFEFKYPQSLSLTPSPGNCSDPTVPALECHGYEISVDNNLLIKLGIDEPGSALICQCDPAEADKRQAEIIKTRTIIPNTSGLKIYKHVEYRTDGKTIFDNLYSFQKSGVDYFETSPITDDIFAIRVYFASSDFLSNETSDPKFLSNEKLTEQILSTFKFITPVASSSAYTNDQYGFSIALPDSWKGYTVLNSQWEGRDVASGAVTEHGPLITLRHPLWTAAAPREDMPVMVFTPAQWALVKNQTMSLGAAPIPPSMLGQNSKYILALPARYNFDNKTGFEEVDQLVHTLNAYEPK